MAPIAPVEVEVIAAAFVDTEPSSTLALSVGPNDAGIDWIDLSLDADDQVTSIEVVAGDDRITIVGGDDGVSVSSRATGFWVDARVGDGEITLVSAEGATTIPADGPVPIEPDADGAARRSPVEFVTAAWRASAGEETPWTYMVDRPLSVVETVDVAVAADLDGERIAPSGSPPWLPTVAGCAGSPESTVSFTCAPGVDSIAVRAEVPIPEESGYQGWKEGKLGIFASEARCEQWRGFAGTLDRIATTYGAAVSSWVGTKQPQIGLVLTGVFWLVDQTVMARINSVPCSTITVADELIEEYRDANAGFTVDLAVSGTPLASYSGGEDDPTLAFSTESIAVQPFATPGAATVVLAATSSDGAETADADAEAEADGGDEAPSEDAEPTRATSGVWTGTDTYSSPGESSSSEYVGSATVVLADGVYTVTYEITHDSFTHGHDACSSHTVTKGEASGPAEDNGRIVFIGQASVVTESDCRFYESKGGRVEETTERAVTGYLLDDDVMRLDLLPASSIEMPWTPG